MSGPSMNDLIRKATGRHVSSAEQDERPKRHPTADAGTGREPLNLPVAVDMNDLLRGRA